MADYVTTMALVNEAIVRVLERRRIDGGALLAALGVDPASMRDPNVRLDLATVRRIWERCVALTGNACFGFEVGMAIRPTNLHAVGYAWLASRSVTDAIGRLARFGRVVSSAGRVRPQSVGDELVVDIELHDRMPQQSIDAYTSAIVALVREISDQTFAPLRVEMRRPEPPCARELDAFFRCPIAYGAARQRLVFRRDDADRLLPRQDAAMAQASDEVAARYIARLDRTDVVARARIELVAMLSDGEPTRRVLAARLHTSERTLSRRLRESGISFRALLDDVRREFAQSLLSQSQYSVTEVTFLLGFADQSNFARSFRRWTGQSPSDYRTNLR